MARPCLLWMASSMTDGSSSPYKLEQEVSKVTFRQPLHRRRRQQEHQLRRPRPIFLGHDGREPISLRVHPCPSVAPAPRSPALLSCEARFAEGDPRGRTPALRAGGGPAGPHLTITTEPGQELARRAMPYGHLAQARHIPGAAPGGHLTNRQRVSPAVDDEAQTRAAHDPERLLPAVPSRCRLGHRVPNFE